MMDFTLAVPIIIAVVSACKTAGMNSKLAPFLSIALGMAFMYFWGSNVTVESKLLEGLIAGLSASGIYSGVKAQLK
jgi:hypothetical protein